MGRLDLENRLIRFAVNIDTFCVNCQILRYRKHLKDQLLRSSCSVALNYAEAQSAESDKDFQHKTSIVLKEVRETQVALKIVSGLQKQNVNGLAELLSEVDELVRIFHSIQRKVRDKQVLE